MAASVVWCQPRRLCAAVLTVYLGIVPLSAQADGRNSGQDLGDILLRKGIITPEELREARDDEQQQRAGEASRLDALRETLPKWLDRLTPFGDIRLRHEGFYQEDKTARNRFRLRARIGLGATISEEISGTVRLATGNANDPISTNQTLDGTFSRKSINLDWAYLTLKPGTSLGITPGWLVVTAGKFGVSTYRPSELVWDDDVAPEGATETLSLRSDGGGFLRGLRLHAFQWVVDEVSDGGDPWITGGQVVGETALDERASWTLALADYYYDHVNVVARKFLNPYADPPTNAKPSASFNNQLANSNSVITDSNGKILRYASAFNVLNAASALDAPDPFGLGIPAGLFGDLAYNTAADGRNVGLYVGAGVGQGGRDWYRNPLAQQGDWGLSYTYAWVEKDAVLSIFSFSEMNEFSTLPARAGAARPTQKGATNLISHILRFDYAVLANLQLMAKASVINALDRKASDAALTGNPTLLRTQLDAMLRF